MKLEQINAWWEKHPVNTRTPTEKILKYEDFLIVPHGHKIAAFARHLFLPYQKMSEHFMGQIEPQYWEVSNYGYPDLTPAGFVSSTNLELLDIKTNGRFLNRKSNPHIMYDIDQLNVQRALENLNPKQVAALYRAVPDIAKVGFPKDFAHEVNCQWEDVLKHRGYIEDKPNKTVDEVKPINETVTSAAMAKYLIVDAAEDVVVELDWNWATGEEVLKKQVRAYFLASVPVILNDPHFISSLRVMDKADNHPALRSLGAHQRAALDTNSVLAMISDSIDARSATYLKDWLCIHTLEEIALRMGQHRDDAEAIAGNLLTTNLGLLQSTQRMMQFLSNS